MIFLLEIKVINNSDKIILNMINFFLNNLKTQSKKNMNKNIATLSVVKKINTPTISKGIHP